MYMRVMEKPLAAKLAKFTFLDQDKLWLYKLDIFSLSFMSDEEIYNNIRKILALEIEW